MQNEWLLSAANLFEKTLEKQAQQLLVQALEASKASAKAETIAEKKALLVQASRYYFEFSRIHPRSHRMISELAQIYCELAKIAGIEDDKSELIKYLKLACAQYQYLIDELSPQNEVEILKNSLNMLAKLKPLTDHELDFADIVEALWSSDAQPSLQYPTYQ